MTAARMHKTFQPTFLGRGAEISLQARELLRILRDLRRQSLKNGLDYTWPKQSTLARRMGKSVRSIRAYLKELELAGWIGRVRTNRNNRYYLLDAHVEELSPGDCPSGPAENAIAYSEDLKVKNSSSKGSAAADLFLPIEIQEASQALRELQFPLADKFAAHDSALVLVAAPWLRWRLTAANMPAIRNRAGFIRACLTKPADSGFTRDAAGRWQAPPIEAVDTAAKERVRRDAARRLAQARDRDARPPSLDWSPGWLALTQAERDDITREVRARHHQGPAEGAMFRAWCMKILAERHGPPCSSPAGADVCTQAPEQPQPKSPLE